MTNYNLEDIVKGYHWLGHDDGYTELTAVPGEELTEKAKRGLVAQIEAYPDTWYVQDEGTVRKFIELRGEGYLLMYGLNPRPGIILNKYSYPTSATEEDIKVVQNHFLDFDFLEKNTSKQLVEARKLFFRRELPAYFQDLGLLPPTMAFSGNGMHALCAHPRISTGECPDMAARWKKFTADCRSDYGLEFENLEMKLDNTSDNRRMVKMYGTCKPEKSARLSLFYGGERVEDESLLERLLNMELTTDERAHGGNGATGDILKLGDDVPKSFLDLMAKDEVARNLFSGRSERGRSHPTCIENDYALLRYLLEIGYRDLDVIGTVLANNPGGVIMNEGGGQEYIRKTIAAALVR